MKPQTIRRSALLSAFVFGTTACIGQSNVVYYGANSNSLDVVFADTNLSVSVKSNIVVDLNVCLQNWGKSAELRLRNEDGSAGYLYISTVCPSYPEDIAFPENIVSNGVSGVALQVSKELSDAYTNAFAFAAAHSNEVKAAYEFVRFVSSTNFHSVTPADLPNYILERNKTVEEVIAGAQKQIDFLQSLSYTPPSILGFRYYEHGPAASNLWVFVSCADPPLPGDKEEWDCFPAIWHEGRWKFSFWGWFDY